MAIDLLEILNQGCICGKCKAEIPKERMLISRPLDMDEISIEASCHGMKETKTLTRQLLKVIQDANIITIAGFLTFFQGHEIIEHQDNLIVEEDPLIEIMKKVVF